MRLIARFVQELNDGSLQLHSVFDQKRTQEVIENNQIETLSKRHPNSVWFERKLTDDFGVEVIAGYEHRPLLHHERFPEQVHPMQKSFQETQVAYTDFKPYPYEVVSGEGVFEVAVGPIHAGIIEPGHFQFSQAGEDMLHLEVRHFYTYRGIEKMLEGKTLAEAKPIIERISGNESIAYQILWRDLMAQSTLQTVPEDLRAYHAILLEMERLIHHLTDLGFIPNDAGFGAALAYGSQMAERARRQLQKMTGHRFGFGAVNDSIPEMDWSALTKYLNQVEEELAWFQDWIGDIPSLWDRLETTGRLEKRMARYFDCVGVVARASGIEVDCRQTEWYQQHGFKLMTEKKGDVAARFNLRIKEAFNSLKMMHNFAETCQKTPRPGQFLWNLECLNDGRYETTVESSIGELYGFVSIQNGLINRWFSRDPSFINWQVVHQMMTRDIIADFPLINKSCDLSYAGTDL